MGSYLFFRLADRSPEHVAAVNEWLREQPEYAELSEYGPHGDGAGREFRFVTADDREQIREDHGEGSLVGMADPGEGKVKVNGLNYMEEDPDRIRELWATLFGKLHEHTTVEVYSGSCALGYAYFNREQVATIANDGDALTGDYTTLSELFEQMDGVEAPTPA